MDGIYDIYGHYNTKMLKNVVFFHKTTTCDKKNVCHIYAYELDGKVTEARKEW